MPILEKASTNYPLQYSVRSVDSQSVKSIPTEATTEEEVVNTETEVITKENETVSETPEETSCTVEDGIEDSEDDDSIKPDPLTPYSIALLHQVLAFLISVTNPSKLFFLYFPYQ